MSGFANLWSGSTLFPLSVTEGQPQLSAQVIDTFFFFLVRQGHTYRELNKKT